MPPLIDAYLVTEINRHTPHPNEEESEMLQRLKERRIQQQEEEGGFTLIELLVVIIILGILAAVVVFAVGGVGDKGASAACVIDTRTIRTAEEASSANGKGYTNAQALKDNGFLSEVPTYHSVSVTVSGVSNPFDIVVAAGGNGKCGNTGDIVGVTDGAR